MKNSKAYNIAMLIFGVVMMISGIVKIFNAIG